MQWLSEYDASQYHEWDFIFATAEEAQRAKTGLAAAGISCGSIGRSDTISVDTLPGRRPEYVVAVLQAI